MCFSAEASLGVAVALLPAGAYCIDAAWRKNRRYLLLAVVPLFFGLQQLCEGIVWIGINQNRPEMIRMATLAYLGFALALWPVWVPIAFGALDSRRKFRLAMAALAGVGLLFGFACYVPIAAATGRGVEATVLGHSIRYDLSVVPVTHSFWWKVLQAAYIGGVLIPMLVSGNRQLRPLGAGVIFAALVSYLFFEYAFSSVWCFFAAILSLYLVRVLYVIPAAAAVIDEPSPHPIPSN